MDKQARIYVAGHTGLVGSALVRTLIAAGYHNLILRTHQELDLTRQADVECFFDKEQPEYVIDAAALVGGIKANSLAPADFFYINMAIEENLIWTAYRHHVKKFLFLGSACMYPKVCPQPMRETELLTGAPEITNEGYALAKIGGSRLCSYLNQQYGVDFISAVPANTYGINDCFDSQKAHVIPSFILKFLDAKHRGAEKVEIWGTGKPLREFIYSDDLAGACIFLMNRYSDPEPINIGVQKEITIMELADSVRRIVGYEGRLEFDPEKPDGMMRRLVDSSKIRDLGWRDTVTLTEGLKRVYKWYDSSRKDTVGMA